MSGIRRLSHAFGRRSLLMRFGAVSALVVALLAGLLTHWLARIVADDQAQSTARLAVFATNLAAGVVVDHGHPNGVPTPAQVIESEKIIQAGIATGDFLAATAWFHEDSGTWLVAFASERPTGVAAQPPAEVVTAFRTRQPVPHVVHRGDPLSGDPTESALLKRTPAVLEMSTVLRVGSVESVVQSFVDYAPTEAAISRRVHRMLLYVLGGMTFLWMVLFQLVWSASRRLRRQSDENWQLASHDTLTGLPNRSLLRDRSGAALRASARTGGAVGLLLLDLDRFKEVNDTLGHHHGDLLLQQVGPRLERVLRPVDSVARLGGDEFVVLLPDLRTAHDAVEVGERIAELLAEPFTLDGVLIDGEASIGVAVSPEHGDDFDTLLQHADVGMYAAKASHVGISVYSADADAHSPHRLALLGELRRALTSSDELVLHFQPKAELATGYVTGVEALVRWQHPAHGLLPPVEFIPAAESTGLIRPLTLLVLEQALAQARAWLDEGLHLRMAVNVSTRCLLDTELPDAVAALLERYDVAAADLGLEITESSIMADPARALGVLTRLAALGVSLSIDDFGTGYSSMAYLQRLPVHELKIDRTFVTNITTSSSDDAIVRSSLDLARNLGLTVVAEGVETADAWDRLAELGCDTAQGYFLARPMPPEQMGPWMARRLMGVVPGSAPAS